MDEKCIPVRVALRARPLVSKEIFEGCQNSLTFVPNQPQLVVGQDKAFTFDYVFPCDSKQEQLYSSAIADRIDYLFKGYNVTVLAYGQTGSGKTYTMGTSYSSSSGEDRSESGVIQRAVEDIFAGIAERSSVAEFLVKVSFLEVYKEDVYNLLQKNKDSPISIREDYDGIKIVGLTEQPVTTAEETFQALEQGSLSRTTASTAMNARSSRSHAIFTITIEQRTLSDLTDFKRAKFHLVDLAGSERANKTGALGERFKEGVNINRGLLALGNVISSLCDESSHIPYRDSKLTRLLQDSLGGNSHTIMIACISPADSNLDETINTLRYADRARKIKNKPIVNRDPQNAELMQLKQQIQQLQLQLLQNQSIYGNHVLKSDEKQKTQENMKVLLERNKHLESENQRLAKELQYAVHQTTTLCEKALMAEMSKEKVLQKLEDLQIKTNKIIEECMEISKDDPQVQALLQLLKEWQNKIIEIQRDQMQKDEEFSLYSPSKKGQMDLSNGLEASSNESEDEMFLPASDGAFNGEENIHLKSTLKQAAMNRELQELDRVLALKEDEASKLKECDSQMSVMRIHYECNLKQMEDEISQLQKEKEELLQALKFAHSSVTANKISEQRRKRLQELEGKISDMKKQIQEKSRILRIKEEAEKKVVQLQQEIQGMRSTRVKLLRQIKEEAERYRTLKQEKEREVQQLKRKDKKRQYEMAKLKEDFTKQKTVLKRKLEEAAAANRRLNDALQTQRKVAERRLKEKQQTLQGVGSRVQQWLIQEIEVLLSIKEAQHHLDILLEDRKTISVQLNLLQKDENTGEPPEKKRLGDSTDEVFIDESETAEQIEVLKKELEMRNLQIADLQRKIYDADQDEKNKHRWESVQSMLEAKCAMKWLFDSFISSKSECYLLSSKTKSQIEALENELSAASSKVQKLTDNNDQLMKLIRNLKSSHNEQICKLNREHEDKVIYFLKQLNSSNTNGSLDYELSIKERMKFQEKEISRLAYLNEELQTKCEENENLRKELILVKYKGNKKLLNNNIVDTDKENSKINRTAETSTSMMEDFLEESLESSYDEEYAKNADPDWKATPITRQRSKNSLRNNNSSCSGCSCKITCSKKRCGCIIKHKKFCSEFCKCKEGCPNRDSDTSAKSCEPQDVMNATFVTGEASQTCLTDITNCSSDKNVSESDDFIKPIRKAKKIKKLYHGDNATMIDESGISRLKNRPRNLLTPVIS